MRPQVVKLRKIVAEYLKLKTNTRSCQYYQITTDIPWVVLSSTQISLAMIGTIRKVCKQRTICGILLCHEWKPIRCEVIKPKTFRVVFHICHMISRGRMDHVKVKPRCSRFSDSLSKMALHDQITRRTLIIVKLHLIK